MNSRKFLIRLLSLIFIIFLLNYLASQFYWYTSIWYFDMIMHFLGGVWLGMAIIWLSFKYNFNSSIDFNFFTKIILGVLFIGIFWEIFEIVLNNYTTQNDFNILDTLSDLFFDLAGGFFVILYFFKKIMPIKKILYN